MNPEVGPEEPTGEPRGDLAGEPTDGPPGDPSGQPTQERPVFSYVTDDAPADVPAQQPPDGPLEEPLVLGAVAVLCAALGGIGLLLSGLWLLGWLHILAWLLLGVALGSALLAGLAMVARRFRARWRMLLAGLTAGALAAAMTVPAVLDTRPQALADVALARTAPLIRDDQVVSVPVAGAPVLIRYGDGAGTLLSAQGAETIPAQKGTALGLSADGRWLVQAGPERTVLTGLAGPASSQGGGEAVSIPGTLLALTADTAITHHCEADTCRLSGFPLEGGEPAARWSVLDSADPVGQDGEGHEFDPTGSLPPLGRAFATTGLVPSAPVRFDPAQGWVWIDPATGVAVGRVLARPTETCHAVSTTAAARDAAPLQAPNPAAVLLCAEGNGVLTAHGIEGGAERWVSEGSPSGAWRAEVTQGAVLATGTETGTDVQGEMIASPAQSAWQAPGGDLLDAAVPMTARFGIDAAVILGVDADHRVVGYDSVTGQSLWSAGAEGEVRGALSPGSAVTVDQAPRRAPLDPTGATRLRIGDPARGLASRTVVTRDDIREVRAVGVRQALVVTDEATYLIGGSDRRAS